MAKVNKRYRDHPVGSLVLVEVEPLPKSHGAIQLHSSDDEYESEMKAHTIGIIREIGEDAFHREGYVLETKPKVGDRVRFKRYGGQEFYDAQDEHGKEAGSLMRMLADHFIVGTVDVEEVE